MLGRLMMIFIIPLILYFTIYPGLRQMADDVSNCNVSAYSNVSFFLNNFNSNQSSSPPGKTDSFGGAGGNYHFGGYNGEVNHREFPINVVATTNNTGEECYGLTDSQRSLINMMPMLFIIGSVLITWFAYRHFFYWGYDDI